MDETKSKHKYQESLYGKSPLQNPEILKILQQLYEMDKLMKEMMKRPNR